MTATLRAFRRHRGYVALSALTLALAVGVNLVVFTIVNAIWLRPRAIPRADRVVMVLGQNDIQATSEGHFFAARGLECFVESQPVFQHVAGQVATSGENAEYEPHITMERLGREVEGMGVTWRYFSVIGGSIRGRDFTADDDRRGAPPVAIISDRLWRESFGADAALIGSDVAATPRPIRIVGVAPPGFHGARLGERADIWVPAAVIPQVARPGVTNESSQPLLALARLKDGVSIADAQKAMDGGTNNCGMRARPGGGGSGISIAVIPIASVYGGPHSRTIVTRESGVMLVVGVTAGLVLLGGCATLMALVLMHYERRRQELAVRIALGCSQRRLTRTLAVELACVGLVGLVGAVVGSRWALGALPSLTFTAGVDFARLNLSLDWRVIAIGLAGTLLTLALASALPMRRSTRAEVALELVSSSSRSTPTSLRLRRLMMAVHAAATVVVLIGAGLFLRTVQAGFSGGAGFNLDRTLFLRAQVGSMTAPGGRTFEEMKAASQAAATARGVRAQELIDRIAGLTGVRAVTIGDAPIGLDQGAWAARSKPVEFGNVRRDLNVFFGGVGPEYFDALGVPILAGRGLTAADGAAGDVENALRPSVVTASFARMLWPNESPVGRRFKVYDSQNEVVGVVADFAQGSLRLNQSAANYVARSLTSATRGTKLSLVVGTSRDPAELVRPIRLAFADLFPNAVELDLATGRDVVSRDLGRERVGASFFTGFGLLALCLGLAGIFGLVSYQAESRRRDLGVRMALGASPRGLIGETVVLAVAPVLAGTVAGMMLAAVAAGAVKASVFGISPLDPLTYVAVGALLAGGAIVAAVSAARRIAGLSPLDALRSL